MLRGRLTHAIVNSLDWLARSVLPADKNPTHHRIGRKGEEAAYFHLRRLGYTMVARNFRSSKHRGEIDLIGWEGNVLCFIEVKTRTSLEIKPPEAAVDQHKRKEIAVMAQEYLRHVQLSCQWRFDIVSVYYESPIRRQPRIEVFRNASLAV